ncbi:gluconate 2-dehydrogenase subunit 3 family protein [Robiginitalea aurantiaca]|uniref:Gluconate 2-dehydrogenase subunit 3 family protein n=1 Tax=Robiginitalea aurantiaca TaxID=3056915 RepID=A0ABT7WI58_9FLAO|nr:gluconate 2-dehydrogenase subunit 3 family protein [Robiginitalea aurantiaca]MDM9632591.1 gluconate 2-dehydrogenase subunit 3 family protein [Robiginitalea aurantiaca]
MDRRSSLKNILLGSVAGGLAVHGCTTREAAEAADQLTPQIGFEYGRLPEELETLKELHSETFLNPHELETIQVLCELILPPNEEFGGPLEAGVPEFIEFMAKDYPAFQPTLRGGLMWLDHKSNTAFGAEFKSASEEQQKVLMDEIAYYDPIVPMDEHPLEIQFFNLMRNLTVSGYYTSKVGIADLGYKGNSPNIWDGVPQEVLDKHGLAYEPEWLEKCVDQSRRGVIALWDDEGNLLT